MGDVKSGSGGNARELELRQRVAWLVGGVFLQPLLKTRPVQDTAMTYNESVGWIVAVVDTPVLRSGLEIYYSARLDPSSSCNLSCAGNTPAIRLSG